MEAFTLNTNDIVSFEEIPFEETFDLTVEKNSNFYLATESNPILVHNCGKGEFIDDVTWRLNKYHEWKTAYFSPENFPLEYHASKIISKFTGKKFSVDCVEPEEYMTTKLHVQQNYFFIYPKDEEFNLETILSKAKYLIRKNGIKVLVIDPWNRLEHQITFGMSETNYISKQLDVIQNFAQKNNILVILVAHPRKIQKKDNVFEVPNLYDINGSANFYNKADYGITVYRNRLSKHVEVYVQKVRFKHLGKTGACAFNYDYASGRFIDKCGVFANENDESETQNKF
jgi:twinkle protein